MREFVSSSSIVPWSYSTDFGLLSLKEHGICFTYLVLSRSLRRFSSLPCIFLIRVSCLNVVLFLLSFLSFFLSFWFRRRITMCGFYRLCYSQEVLQQWFEGWVFLVTGSTASFGLGLGVFNDWTIYGIRESSVILFSWWFKETISFDSLRKEKMILEFIKQILLRNKKTLVSVFLDSYSGPSYCVQECVSFLNPKIIFLFSLIG